MPKKQPGIGKIPGVKVNNSLRQGSADLFVEELEHFPEQFLTIGNRHQLGFDVQQRSGVILRNNFTDCCFCLAVAGFQQLVEAV